MIQTSQQAQAVRTLKNIADIFALNFRNFFEIVLRIEAGLASGRN